jgi:hypothetical protein
MVKQAIQKELKATTTAPAVPGNITFDGTYHHTPHPPSPVLAAARILTLPQTT